MSSFFTIPVLIEHAKLKFALTIPTGAPITVAKAIDIPPLVANKIIKTLSVYSKAAIYLGSSSFLFHKFLRYTFCVFDFVDFI